MYDRRTTVYVILILTDLREYETSLSIGGTIRVLVVYHIIGYWYMRASPIVFLRILDCVSQSIPDSFPGNLPPRPIPSITPPPPPISRHNVSPYRPSRIPETRFASGGRDAPILLYRAYPREFSLLLIAAVVSRLHSAPHESPKLPILRQPRHNGIRTLSSFFVCGGHERRICVFLCVCHVSHRPWR